MAFTGTFLGQIKIFAGTSVPDGWLPCDGREMPTTGYETLRDVIGTTYGYGVQFRLPDLRGRTPIHVLTPSFQFGSYIGGEESHALSLVEMPPHTHNAGAHATASAGDPTGRVLGGGSSNAFATDPTGNVTMAAEAVDVAGSSTSHSNMQPYLALNFYICVSGGEVPVP